MGVCPDLSQHQVPSFRRFAHHPRDTGGNMVPPGCASFQSVIKAWPFHSEATSVYNNVHLTRSTTAKCLSDPSEERHAHLNVSSMILESAGKGARIPPQGLGDPRTLSLATDTAVDLSSLKRASRATRPSAVPRSWRIRVMIIDVVSCPAQRREIICKRHPGSIHALVALGWRHQETLELRGSKGLRC